MLAEATGVSEQIVYAMGNTIADGVEIDANTLQTFAHAMGVDQADVEARFEQIRGAFEAQAPAKVAKLGLDPQEVFAWAQENQKQALSEAVRRQVHDRSTSGYEALAREYIANLDTLMPDEVLNAQFSDQDARAFVAGDGSIVIKLGDGSEWTWRQACEFGIIGVPKWSD